MVKHLDTRILTITTFEWPPPRSRGNAVRQLWEEPGALQAKLALVASYCFIGKCQSIGSSIGISLVGSGQRPHVVASRNQSRCRDSIRPRLESGNCPETNICGTLSGTPTQAYTRNDLLRKLIEYSSTVRDFSFRMSGTVCVSAWMPEICWDFKLSGAWATNLQ